MPAAQCTSVINMYTLGRRIRPNRCASCLRLPKWLEICWDVTENTEKDAWGRMTAHTTAIVPSTTITWSFAFQEQYGVAATAHVMCLSPTPCYKSQLRPCACFRTKFDVSTAFAHSLRFCHARFASKPSSDCDICLQWRRYIHNYNHGQSTKLETTHEVCLEYDKTGKTYLDNHVCFRNVDGRISHF